MKAVKTCHDYTEGVAPAPGYASARTNSQRSESPSDRDDSPSDYDKSNSEQAGIGKLLAAGEPEARVQQKDQAKTNV